MMTTSNLLWIILGSGLGGGLRHIVSTGLQTIIKHHGFLYLSTAFVNISGCFAIGFLSSFFLQKELLHHKPIHHNQGLVIFMLVGFLGGYTTFSTFSLEVVNHLLQGRWLHGMGYATFNTLLCIAATWLGMAAYRALN